MAVWAAQSLGEAQNYVRQMDAKIAVDVPYVTLFNLPTLEYHAKSRIEVPFIRAVGGLQLLNGAPHLVRPVGR